MVAWSEPKMVAQTAELKVGRWAEHLAVKWAADWAAYLDEPLAALTVAHWDVLKVERTVDMSVDATAGSMAVLMAVN